MFGIWQAGKRSRGLVFPSKFSGASCSNFCFTWVLVVKLRAAHFEWLRSCLVCNMPIDLDFSFYIISPTFDVRRYCWSLNFCQLISIFPDAYLKLLFSTFFLFWNPYFFSLIHTCDWNLTSKPQDSHTKFRHQNFRICKKRKK